MTPSSLSNDSVFTRLVAKVDEYRREDSTSAEVKDHYLADAVGAPSVDALMHLAVRAAASLLPYGEQDRETLMTVALAWTMGAAAGAGAATSQEDAIRAA